MLETSLVTDLAIILILASVVSFIFHKLKQPVVLGYIIAGIIIGPYTPPFGLLSEPEIISALAEIGIILLLFGIGLHFPLRKLLSLGKVALIVSGFEIPFMLILSLLAGRLLGWGIWDSLFLGAALACSSTTIISKYLGDTGRLNEASSSIMLGVLIIEDLVVVIMLATLQSVATIGSVSIMNIAILVGKMALFAAVSIILGWKFMLPFIDRVQRESTELLILIVVGLCFAFSIGAFLLGFSTAIGAFIAGVILASWEKSSGLLFELTPVTDIFGAIFFVSFGALMDISKVLEFFVPAMIITALMFCGKIIGCSLGTKASGYDWPTAVSVGLGMSQIGEFAFIVVKVGSDLEVLSVPLLSMIGIAAIVTTFARPYLIEVSHRGKTMRI